MSKADQYRARATWFGSQALEARTQGEKSRLMYLQAVLLDIAEKEETLRQEAILARREAQALHPTA